MIGLTEYTLTAGYRLSYHAPAVAEIFGETNIAIRDYNMWDKKNRNAPFKYNPEKYFRTSETQNVIISVADSSIPGSELVVLSESKLNIPDKFVPSPDSPGYVDASIRGRDFRDFLKLIGEEGVFLFPLGPKTPKIMLGKVKDYQDYGKVAAPTSPADFDEFMAQDCTERFRLQKLPWLNREFWGPYIEGPDSQDAVMKEVFSFERFARLHQPVFSYKEFYEKPGWAFFAKELNESLSYSAYVHEKRWEDFDYADARMDYVMARFEEEYGIEFDDVVEYMDDKKRIYEGEGFSGGQDARRYQTLFWMNRVRYSPSRMGVWVENVSRYPFRREPLKSFRDSFDSRDKFDESQAQLKLNY